MRINEVKVGMICALEDGGYYGRAFGYGTRDELDKMEEKVQKVEVLEIVKVTESRDAFSERTVRRVKVRLSRPRRRSIWDLDRMDPVERELHEVDDIAIVEASELVAVWDKFQEMLRRARAEEAAKTAKQQAVADKVLEINRMAKERGLPEPFPEFEYEGLGDTITKGIRFPMEWHQRTWVVDILLALVKGETADANQIEQWLFERGEG